MPRHHARGSHEILAKASADRCLTGSFKSQKHRQNICLSTSKCTTNFGVKLLVDLKLNTETKSVFVAESANNDRRSLSISFSFDWEIRVLGWFTCDLNRQIIKNLPHDYCSEHKRESFPVSQPRLQGLSFGPHRTTKRANRMDSHYVIQS